MCTLKSPMSQLLSNKSVKVFSHQNGEGGGGGGGTKPPKKFLRGGGGGGGSAPKKFLLGGAGGGGVRPPCSPLRRSL